MYKIGAVTCSKERPLGLLLRRKSWKSFQNVAANFLVYHKLGNVGFLGFSGAASFQDTKPYFEEAGNEE